MSDKTELVKTKDGKEIPKHCLCEYCGNDARDGKVTRVIWVNHQEKRMKFCCMAAGGMYQMGCEG